MPPDQRAMMYLMGQTGTPYLQQADFHILGFQNPRSSFEVVFPLHSKFMRNYELQTRDGYRRGPDVKSLTTATTIEALTDTNQDAVIDWYELFTATLEPYGVQLMPFDEIELMYGPYAYCIPGIGLDRYNETGLQQGFYQ
jgi:hypothetical protein